MTFVNSEGREFDSLEEMMAEYERNMTVWQRIRRRYCWHLRNPIRNAKRSVRFAYQRVTRGWDDPAAWGMCRRLPKSLGEQLVAMAEMAHGYPDGYPDHHLDGCLAYSVFLPDKSEKDAAFERWVADLRTNGEALLALSRLEWLDDGFDEAYAAAQDALRWVADNLGALWD